LARFVSVTFGIALSLFGVLFVVVYLLANVRKIKAAYLMPASSWMTSPSRSRAVLAVLKVLFDFFRARLYTEN
jgi:hypothetical protein